MGRVTRGLPYTRAMVNRAPDWFAEAEFELATAEDLVALGRHAPACFMAQQAAEKAVKALHLHLLQNAWGHSIAELLRELPPAIGVPPDRIQDAMALDLFYIPSHYPDAHSEGAPFQKYGPLQAEQAVKHARAIVEFIRHEMAAP